MEDSPLAANLQRHRKKAGLSQAQAAHKVGVIKRTLERWEASSPEARTTPEWKYLLAMARIYDCTVADFYAQPASEDEVVA